MSHDKAPKHLLRERLERGWKGWARQWNMYNIKWREETLQGLRLGDNGRLVSGKGRETGRGGGGGGSTQTTYL